MEVIQMSAGSNPRSVAGRVRRGGSHGVTGVAVAVLAVLAAGCASHGKGQAGAAPSPASSGTTASTASATSTASAAPTTAPTSAPSPAPAGSTSKPIPRQPAPSPSGKPIVLELVPASADPRSDDLAWQMKGASGRVVTLAFTQGGCVHATGVSVTETATTVALRLHAERTAGICASYLVQVTGTVELPHALNGRSLVRG